MDVFVPEEYFIRRRMEKRVAAAAAAAASGKQSDVAGESNKRVKNEKKSWVQTARESNVVSGGAGIGEHFVFSCMSA
ncbi:hypothetical protein SLE2022_088130 [Rubroshorea leprosula]